MINLRLGIVGGGVVGAATARSYVEHIKQVCTYDVRSERRTHDLVTVLGCDIVMICLPTPQKNGTLACDTSFIESFFKDNPGTGHINFVIRSTVPPGFTRRMQDTFNLRNITHSPEFLTARCADLNAMQPSRNLIGVPSYKEPKGAQMLNLLYTSRWPHVPVRLMSSTTTEMVKLMTNGFFATKVAFFNEMYQFARAIGADWDDVMHAFRMDGRVNPCHTDVPGTDGMFGFGGACLPKDLASLVEEIHRANVPGPYVTLAALERNKVDRDPQEKSRGD